MKRVLTCIAMLLMPTIPTVAAEVQEVRISEQFGTSGLPLMMMERHQLIEKAARDAGLGEVKVVWSKFAGPAVSNDALLSGSLDVALNGAPALLLLWDKTRGTEREIRGLSSVSSNPSILVTRNPDVQSIADFSPRDRIALPGIKISLNAIMLGMAAEKAFGASEWKRLDPLMVPMGHPDALAAMLSQRTEITAHMSNPPYSTAEIKRGMRPILTAKDVLGGQGWDMILTASTKFHDGNPRTVGAMLAALREAITMINKDKRAAAQTYLEMSGDKQSSVDDILAIIDDPDTVYSTTPTTVMQFAEFMQRVGMIKSKPASMQEAFFVNALP